MLRLEFQVNGNANLYIIEAVNVIDLVLLSEKC